MRAPGWTKQRVRDMQALNYEILRRYGAFPGADRTHTIEFVPGFSTEASDWGRRWGVEPTTIEERKEREVKYLARLDERMQSAEPPRGRSTELVIDVVEALETGSPAVLPMNIPNRGHCPDLPDEVIVESMCIADGDGIRGRDCMNAPPALVDLLRRLVATQELTVDAAVTGDRDTVLAVLFTDPLAGSLDHDARLALRDTILESTRDWLPQFA
jgi:alpha-galactosidase/6-phospho-beta-glucosidase family protein